MINDIYYYYINNEEQVAADEMRILNTLYR